MVKAKIVTSNFQVKSIMMTCAPTTGKTALEKAKFIAKTLEHIANGNNRVMEILQSKIQVFVSDGEGAEPLAARFSEENGTLPCLKAVIRCGTHASTRALENSLSSDPRVENLITLLINGYSSASNNDGEHGGLARAIRNSPKLANLLAQEQVLRMKSFAPQRFGTLTEVAQHLVLNVKPVFQTLLKLNSTWSQRLLRECFQPKALCLLALVAEFAGAALRFTRKLDSGSLPAAAIGRAVQALEAELRDLFDFKDCRGHPQEPLVLSSKFQMGYIQILCREFDLLSTEAVHDGSGPQLLWYKAGCQDLPGLRKCIAKELASIQNVSRVYLQAVKADTDTHVSASLAPFDVQWWQETRSDETLSEVFTPLCAALGLKAKDLSAEYLVARKTVEHLQATGTRNIDVLWGKACDHWSTKLPTLCAAVSFMLSAYSSTSSLEQDFSFLQMFTDGRKNRTSFSNVLSLMKCRLDGGPPSDVAQCAHNAGGVQVLASGFCTQIQSEYAAKFGAAPKGCRDGNLPRRILGQKDKPGMASFKRKRDEQIEAIKKEAQEGSPPVASDLEQLQQTVEKHARKRVTEKQEDLALRMQKYADQRKRLLLEDGSGSAGVAAKLKSHEEKALKEKQRLEALERRSLAVQLDRPALPFGVPVVATTDRWQAMAELGADYMVWPHNGQLQSQLIISLLKSTVEPIWLCCSDKDEEQMLFDPSKTVFTATATLVGGGVAGPTWADLAISQKKLVPTVLRLHRALSTQQHVHFHKSLQDVTEPAAKALVTAHAAAQTCVGVSGWNVVQKWKHMRHKTGAVVVSESYFDDLKEQKYMGKRMTAAALVTQLMSWR